MNKGEGLGVKRKPSVESQEFKQEFKQDGVKSAFENSEQSIKFNIKGKFLYAYEEKYYIKGITYGTFTPDEDGVNYPPAEIVEKDFFMMAENGFNAVRTYTIPPSYLLELAGKYDLHVMIGIPWEQHIAFLDIHQLRNDIIKRVRESVARYKGNSAVLCYTIGNEIPAPIVRWHGKAKIERFLKQLFYAAKEADPDRLITYVNYPTTEYLNLSFLDFVSFNVYLESPEKLQSYLSKLQNIAGDKPLILAEIGIDSASHGALNQANFLKWQLTTAFAKGCAGAFVFAWTDEWWRGGYEIEDWDFGLVDRQRNPKPALNSVSSCIRQNPLSLTASESPFISVIVCSYNGARTIRGCMEALQKLDYPNKEIIVVNDGSTDDLEKIVKEYPVKLISTPNRGLSSARNTGLASAEGEIIAYLDDDAFPDSHWLQYLASAYNCSSHAGIGGPNLPPLEDGPIAACVANAPGGPIHVLLSDEIAEHIPGCNMSFKKEVLMEIEGFDPNFRVAGDDVDVCWRIQSAGYTLGFHPAAVVWHHRRACLKSYWNQQKGYGKAEALLEAKWPLKYNRLGHLTWGGRIYSSGVTLPLKINKDKIYYGTWGSALFQSVYQPADNFWTAIPLMPEWYFLVTLLGITGSLGFLWSPLLWFWPFFVLAILIVFVQATISAVRPIRRSCKKMRVKYRLLVIVLYVMQPLARLYGRLAHGLTPWRTRCSGRTSRFLFQFQPTVFTYWSDRWQSAEGWLTEIEKELIYLKLRVKRGGEFDPFDMQLQNGLFCNNKVILAVEEHGGGNQFLRFKCIPKVSVTEGVVLAIPALLAFSAWADGEYLVSLVLTVIFLALLSKLVYEHAACLSCLYAAFHQVSKKKSYSEKAAVTKGRTFFSDFKESAAMATVSAKIGNKYVK
ncbi:MAG: glycosyltransferase [Mucilaginibacter sp.]|nr:glycosyltransferase [Mucilaginibacter sp.]